MHRSTSRLLTLVLGLSAGAVSAAPEAYVTYDNFDGSQVDLSRWTGEMERSRLVNDGALILRARDHGLTTSDTGQTARYWGNYVNKPSRITQLRASVRVNAVDVTGCQGSGNPSNVQARLLGTFFNTGKPVAGNSVGDLLAWIYVFRDSTTTDPQAPLIVRGSAIVCTTSDCNQGNSVGPTVSLGTLAVGATTTLRMEWDRTNKRIVFGRDTGERGSIAYGSLTDTIDPARPFQGVGLRTGVASCLSGPVPYADMTARFDNIAINASALP